MHGVSVSEKPRYIELYAATDVSIYNEFDQDEDKVKNYVRNIIKNLNSVSL